MQGNYRYKLYYSKWFGWLMRNHIREQIDARIRSMDTVCLSQGSCKLCGCQTTHLQMANKACDKPCYPPMVDSYTWFALKQGYSIIRNRCWVLKGGKFSEIRDL